MIRRTWLGIWDGIGREPIITDVREVASRTLLIVDDQTPFTPLLEMLSRTLGRFAKAGHVASPCAGEVDERA
ncbi:hypothetical protein D3C87_1549550 [compost metagenome]